MKKGYFLYIIYDFRWIHFFTFGLIFSDCNYRHNKVTNTLSCSRDWFISQYQNRFCVQSLYIEWHAQNPFQFQQAGLFLNESCIKRFSFFSVMKTEGFLNSFKFIRVILKQKCSLNKADVKLCLFEKTKVSARSVLLVGFSFFKKIWSEINEINRRI